jgi:hypothetical protein
MKKNVLSFVLVAISMLISQSIFAGDNDRAFYNSLLINGKPLINEQFSLSSRGVLTMVMNDTKTKEKTVVLFKIYLKRQNNIVPLGGSAYESELSEIEVYDILKFANLGDHLIIEPVDKKQQTATRVIFLRQSFFLEFLNRGNNKDGC